MWGAMPPFQEDCVATGTHTSREINTNEDKAKQEGPLEAQAIGHLDYVFQTINLSTFAQSEVWLYQDKRLSFFIVEI